MWIDALGDTKVTNICFYISDYGCGRRIPNRPNDVNEVLFKRLNAYFI